MAAGQPAAIMLPADRHSDEAKVNAAVASHALIA